MNYFVLYVYIYRCYMNYFVLYVYMCTCVSVCIQEYIERDVKVDNW